MCSSERSEKVAGETPGRAAERRLFELERQRRQLDAQIAAVMNTVERDGSYGEDGHLNVRSWALAVTNWSPGEATARARMARALTALPAVHDAFTAGELGSCQVRAFARAHANPRVTAQLPGSEGLLLEDALALRFQEFNGRIRGWTELADADGAHRRHGDSHRMRSARLTDVGDETLLAANLGTMQGAEMREIFEAFCDAEFAADLEAAGPTGVLARTDSQRRADALMAIFRAAAAGGMGGTVNVVVNIMIDKDTYETELRRIAGAPTERRDPATYRSYRCETADGTRLDPTEVVAASIIGEVRRVVFGAASTVIDLGRKRRFTGAARTALLLQDRCCTWPGCTVPARRTQGDHAHAHSKGGRTNPDNGDLMCGRHNRFKNQGYRTVRDQHGLWHTYRPDGTEVGRPLVA